MENRYDNRAARDSIFQSIRANLASSVSLDEIEDEIRHAKPSQTMAAPAPVFDLSLTALFKANLELVDGHCVVVRSETEVADATGEIIRKLQNTKLLARRIAISDAPGLEQLVKQSGCDVDEVAVTPSAAEVFRFDVGISTVQAGIAETGTLLLDSSRERHRLVSLVPPVHIALLDGSQIVGTLGEALSLLRKSEQVSPIVTLVTGPSRTADIELTLAIGVHGPQELFVIVNETA
jgi:L-lactate dehydrogenase complex protein LldG